MSDAASAPAPVATKVKVFRVERACPACQALNHVRRTHCTSCGAGLPAKPKPKPRKVTARSRPPADGPRAATNILTQAGQAALAKRLRGGRGIPRQKQDLPRMEHIVPAPTAAEPVQDNGPDALTIHLAAGRVYQRADTDAAEAPAVPTQPPAPDIADRYTVLSPINTMVGGTMVQFPKGKILEDRPMIRHLLAEKHSIVPVDQVESVVCCPCCGFMFDSASPAPSARGG